MLTFKQGIMLSAIIDKINLEIPDASATQEEVGASLIMQILSKAHKAEQEIYNFIAEIKKIDVKEAEGINLIEFTQELLSNAGIADFFKSAVKSKVQG